ncbi:hypothetical protein MSG28_000201 [Choristoneura fumiferana]|uniref:Uncharacterized protein n=1 Tax=Choristoneura fumiferana TaxID=7141 RepID=A0ACC0JZP5_CHOFU|nr:hypothetical protein MSG28_000201 [Choristoneura fumiferana]
MKRVRFITPLKMENLAAINESDCHSPRPFIHRDIEGVTPELPSSIANEIVYSPDPVRRFECSNSSPYPIVKRTDFPVTTRDADIQFSPCNDLELSMLDASSQLPRKPVYFTPLGNLPVNQEKTPGPQKAQHLNLTPESPINVLSPIENTKAVTPPNMLTRGDNFFITRGNLNKFQLQGSLQVQMNKLCVNKENKVNTDAPVNRPGVMGCLNTYCMDNTSCQCHHCIKVDEHNNFNTSTPGVPCGQRPLLGEIHVQNGIKQTPIQSSCNRCMCPQQTKPITTQQCSKTESLAPKYQNAVDKKAWVIEKYEQANNKCTEVEKQINVSKERREPTVGDLLKIIKLQNEQLQLLQEKVDKLISTNSNSPHIPHPNLLTEQVALETVDRDQRKISIGVMTSLEMVRTSTIINKEHIVKQTYDNAQIQCNRSEISIKEVVKQPVNLNFLDGILPVGKTACLQTGLHESPDAGRMSNCNEEKTLNEMSLCNVQVDNATTPLMSPEQSLYLDVRDYSGSDSGSDHSNVGWTYYNKVMTHVNGMLQDSDMPSSASALYRNTRQQCLQMQFDKTNISVTKRVTFGDEPPVTHQNCSTDTSLRMNQLAAKYLKKTPASASPPARQPDVSFATRNYMERHKLIQGQASSSRRAAPGDVPRFLDITTLKQQPKLL